MGTSADQNKVYLLLSSSKAAICNKNAVVAREDELVHQALACTNPDSFSKGSNHRGRSHGARDRTTSHSCGHRNKTEHGLDLAVSIGDTYFGTEVWHNCPVGRLGFFESGSDP